MPHGIGINQVADFHCPHRTCQDAGLTPDTEDADQAENPLEAKEFEGCVGEAFSPGAEGYWASLEEGGDERKANPNPYAGAAMVTVVDGAGAGKRKVGSLVLALLAVVVVIQCLEDSG